MNKKFSFLFFVGFFLSGCSFSENPDQSNFDNLHQEKLDLKAEEALLEKVEKNEMTVSETVLNSESLEKTPLQFTLQGKNEEGYSCSVTCTIPEKK